ncbi:hypothetical protein P7K49_021756, partial [Saguinus oedipus]
SHPGVCRARGATGARAGSSPRRQPQLAAAGARAARPPGGFCKAGACLQRAGHLHEATRPHGAAAAAADPGGGGGGGGGGGARSEPGGPGVPAPVDARLGRSPWAGAEAARGGGARFRGRGRGPEAAAQEEAEEVRRSGPGRRAAQRRSPGLAMLLASAVVVWEWLNEHGRWRPYSPAVSHHIEAVVRAGPRAGGSVVLGQVDSRLAPYIIDLQSMNQFRQDTGEPAAPSPPRSLPPPPQPAKVPPALGTHFGHLVGASLKKCHREVVVRERRVGHSPGSSQDPPSPQTSMQGVSVFLCCKPTFNLLAKNPLPILFHAPTFRHLVALSLSV